MARTALDVNGIRSVSIDSDEYIINVYACDKVVFERFLLSSFLRRRSAFSLSPQPDKKTCRFERTHFEHTNANYLITPNVDPGNRIGIC